MSYQHMKTVGVLFKDGEEKSAKVTFGYYDACRGARDSLGVPLEPDSDAEIEIEKIILLDNNLDVTNSDDVDIENLTEKLFEEIDSYIEDQECALAEAIAEARAERDYGDYGCRD